MNLNRCLNIIICHGVNPTRHLSTTFLKSEPILQNRMKAWQVHSYGEDILLTNSRIPILTRPDDVLVAVEAASVNPIDVAMMNGYGSSLVGLMRQTLDSIEFPITLGRDFSGKVIAKGHNVSEFEVGQNVWGVVPVHSHGSHAESVLVPKHVIAPKPERLSFVEAASMLYAGVTAWSALWFFAGGWSASFKNRKVLVCGASGGVGSMAVQLLNAENAQVVATCSEDAIPLVQSLGASDVLNYKLPDINEQINKLGPYDVIFDCASLGPEAHLSNKWQCKQYVTLTTPLLKNTDQFGLVGGLLTSAAQFVIPNVQALTRGSSIRWAFFTPSTTAINHISDLVYKGHVRRIYGIPNKI